MQALQDALERGLRRADGRVSPVIAWLSVALATALLLGVLTVREDRGPDRCHAPDLAGIWDLPMRQTLHTAFAGTSFGEETWIRVHERVETYVREWTAAWRDTCERARAYPTQTGNERRAACLEERRAELRGLVEVMRTGGATVMAHAVQAVAALPPIAECTASVDESARGPTHGDTPEEPTHTRWLQKARKLQQLGLYRAAYASAEALERAAARGADGVPMAELLLLKGTLLGELGDFRRADAALEQAVHRAESGGSDRVLAEAALGLLEVRGVKLSRFAEAEAWRPHAEAFVRRAGSRKLQRMRLRRILAEIHAQRGAYREAAWNLRTILDELGTGSEVHIERIQALIARADALRRGFPTTAAQDEAWAAVTTAESLWNEVYGPEHPDIARIDLLKGQIRATASAFPESRGKLGGLQQDFLRAYARARGAGSHDAIGAALNDLGNHELCGPGTPDHCRNRLAYFQGALREWQLAYGPEHPKVAIALGNIGLTLRDLEREQEAVRWIRRCVDMIAAALGTDHAR